MKKLTTILITMLLCFSLVSCSCGKSDPVSLLGTELGYLSHDSVDVMGVTYDLYDNGYALIEKILHENAQLNETVSYDGKEYIVIGFFEPKASLMSSSGVFGIGELKSPVNLVLPDSIVSVASHSLANSSANTIQLPSNLQILGNGAFSGCRNIETIDLPNSLTNIFAHMLFQNCVSLKTVEFPKDCEIVFFDNVFENCNSLESVTIPGSVEYIGGGTFTHCYALTNVTIEDGVQEIRRGAFHDCPALESLVIPNSVTLIEDQAFRGCTSLKEIVLPDNMTDVSAGLFADIYSQETDASGITIYVKSDLVSYVQSMYPSAIVVAK